MGSFFHLDAEVQMRIFALLNFADRARLACASRAFRLVCATRDSTCLRRHTDLVVPFPSWERYVRGVERCLARHAAALQTVHIRFQSTAVGDEPEWWDDEDEDGNDEDESGDEDAFGGYYRGVAKQREDSRDRLDRQAQEQAEALQRLCMPLGRAKGLRQLTILLYGRAASAVPARLPALGRLTQLCSLELSCVALDVPGEIWVSALAPLTRLTRLCLEFGDDGSMSCEEGLGEPVAAFPWEAAVCGLVDLQELRVGSDLNDSPCCTGMFKGSLPASLSRLTALRHFEVLGMAEWGTGGAAGLQLAALPALERAALRLQQPSETGQLPTLRRGQLVELCRLVSLSLALRVEEEDYHEDMHLPAIAAPALTELVLDDIKLAADSEQLPWLSDLPKLRRLVLANLRITSRQVPEGVRACSGLTELVLQRMEVGCYSSEMSDYESDHYDKSYLRTLSDGPYLSRLARLSLFGNAFSAVPPALMAATSLELLDMAHQDLPRINVRHWYRHGFIPECDSDPPRVQGLRPLNGLTRLCCVNLCGFEKYDAWIRQFQATHPHVSVILE